MGRLHAEAEEAEAGLDEDGRGEVAGGNNHERPGNVGQYVAEDDAHIAEAEPFCGGDVFHLAEDEHLAADEARCAHPHAEPYGNEYLPKAFADGERDSKHEQQGRDGIEYVDEPHNGLVYHAAKIAGDGAKQDTNGERQQHGHHAHRQRDAGADEQAGEDIAAIAVGAEPEGAGGDEVLFYVFLLGGLRVGEMSGREEGGERVGDGVLQAIVYVVCGDEGVAGEVVIVDG